MKRFLTLIFFTTIVLNINSFKAVAQSSSKLVDYCTTTAGEDATYLKDFVVELPAAGADGKAPEQRYTMLLSKNTEYRLTVCNADGSEGKAMLQLFDMNRLQATSYNAATGQSYQSVNFQCSKTGAYHLVISFIDGKPGSAVAIVSFIRTL